MFLSELNVENFRGIRRGHLSFGETTVLNGENDCGKSSLLDALARVLDATDAEPPKFEPQYFYRTAGPDGEAPAGPIHIELMFRERHAGEWDTPELAALGPLPQAQPAGRVRRNDAAQEHPGNHVAKVLVEWVLSVGDEWPHAGVGFDVRRRQRGQRGDADAIHGSRRAEAAPEDHE